jgi:hypothetical protein
MTSGRRNGTVCAKRRLAEWLAQHAGGFGRLRASATGEGVLDLVERVKAILLTPQTEWPVIEREPGDPPYLFTNYVAILAAIPPVCGFIGMSLIGMTLPVVGTVRVGILTGVASAVIQYLLAFVVVYVLGLVITALAPTFDAQKNEGNALKLAVYSMTPSWLAGVFLLIPALSFLGILGLYGLYLLWVGMPTLTKVPKDKATGYAAAVVVSAIVIFVIISAVASLFARI